VANRLLSTELKSEREKLEGRVAELERTNAELQTKCDKLYNSCELLSRQREDA
jgi:chaperonin cofactor prefoldin